MNGLEKETFERALDLEEEREAKVAAEHRFSRPHAYFSRGLYADLLQPWFALFARERILCLRFEDILENAGDVAARVQRFLELPQRREDAQGLGAVNTSEADTAGLALEARARLASRYAGPSRRLCALLGPDFGTWA